MMSDMLNVFHFIVLPCDARPEIVRCDPRSANANQDCHRNSHADLLLHVREGTKPLIGLVHDVGNGLKATCKAHARCSCWISSAVGPKRMPALIELTQWLANPGDSAPSHLDPARAVKIKLGMKVRS